MANNLFYSIKINSAVVIWNLLEVTDRYRSTVPRATWVESDKIHITLRFLGKEADRDANRDFDTLAKACANQREIRLDVKGTGTFNTKAGPRVLFAKIGDGFTRLHDLFRELGGTGSYTPHITIAKLEAAGDTSHEFGRIAEELKDKAYGKILVTDVLLCRTEGGGKPYTTLASHRLVGEP